MATYSFHRLLTGKVKIDNFSCLNGDIWNLFLQKCLLSSLLRFMCLLSKLLNLFGCKGHTKVNFRKTVKNLLLRNHKADKADTFHTCL